MFEQAPVAKKEQRCEIDPSDLLETERTLLEKFEGKTKQIAKALLLVTALTVMPATIEQAYAKDGNPTETGEAAKAESQESALLNRLFNLPNNPNITPAQKNAMKMRAAQSIVQTYASLHKIAPHEAARKLLGMSSTYAVSNDNAGLKILREMSGI